VQGEAGREAEYAFHAVAVEHADVVITGFDDDEQVHRVGLGHVALAGIRQAAGREGFDAGGADVGFVPARGRRYRRVNPFGQRVDVGSRQHGAKGRHLGGGTTVADGGDGVLALEAFEAFRQQGRAHGTEAVGTVATGAVAGEQFGGVSPRRCRKRYKPQCSKGESGEDSDHGVRPPGRGVPRA